MARISKRMQAIQKAVTPGKAYPLKDALDILKKSTKVKFDETVELIVTLGIDARKSDQVVRGATVLPNGTGKKVRVAVFADGKDADLAKEAGADIVGLESLVDAVKSGEMNFDVAIATPASMAKVGQIGQILGPRGLMPNPKVGTVTTDVVKAVKNAKSGQVQFRADKNGIVHCGVGKVSFEADKLSENILAVINDLKKAKPAGSKGTYLKKVFVSSTMGPGITIDQTTINM